ncbi:MAG TPA: O-acetyl-ADP-ribose deacetylase [bacterium]|nr:O-acetyl-ADP-ribose deacetylase [bacterium]
MKTYFDGRLVVTTGDITREKVDAIVNAANSSLLGGGGVDGAIHRAGGPSILEECRKLRATRFPDGLPTGQAVETGAGRLPARWVIHTVGPVWHGGGQGEQDRLADCYRNSLELAASLGAGSIAFPAISTGIYGYPREKAARVAWSAISLFLAGHQQPATVTLVFFSPDDQRVFTQNAAE